MTSPGPILFCGYNASAEAALKEIGEEVRARGVTVVTRNQVPDFPGVRHVAMDFLSLSNLRSKKVALKDASVCVIFSESRRHESSRTVDMHTILTVYNVKSENPGLPVIAEIIDQSNTEIIRDFNCDDVIYKESIDYSLITTCILHPKISPIVYDLLSESGKTMKQRTLAEAGFGESIVTFRDIRMRGMEVNITYLGCIGPGGEAMLMPSNDTEVLENYRLVYIC
jgi:voltage-gated potassium channel